MIIEENHDSGCVVLEMYALNPLVEYEITFGEKDQ